MKWIKLLSLAMPAVALAQSANEVLLVVNTRPPDSMSIGAYYAERRGVAARNACRISTAPEETIERRVYDKEIAAPVRTFLTDRRLAETILYIATAGGVPLRIRGSGGLNGDAASVDSELTLLYLALHGQPVPLTGPARNPLFASAESGSGRRLPIYLVTRLAAYDVATVKQIVDRSLSARNRGVVALDLKGGNGQGNDWLLEAARRLPAPRVLLDKSPEPLYEAKNVIGYASSGSNEPKRRQRRLSFRWLPGAITTEYVSTNGRTFKRPPDTWSFSSWSDTDKPRWFAGSPQSLAADLIADGASAASGHVYEPYLTLTPRPDLLFPVYLSGRTLAESYYRSTPGLSWQNIVMGDPLCRLR